MKKIININLASRLIPIEDSAYEILRQYLESLKRYFSREDGADEIVSDIESRIAELFQDKLKKGAHCITDEDVQAIKASMGTPEQFEETAADSGPAGAAQEQQAFTAPRPRKRLYRDSDNKVLGGVCSGLGAYLNVDPVVFRIIFALLAIGGFGTGILVYFILWIATPEANTAAEKLEMRGERVDLNNIRATVQDEINSLKGQFRNMGDDVRNFSQGRGRQVGNDIERIFRNFFTGLGKVLLFVTKGFFLFLAVVILICLISVGIAMAASSAALFPLKDLALSSSLQHLLFWPAVIFLIGIPIVALVIFIIRKLTGVRQTNRYVGYTLSFLWVIGLLCGIGLAISVGKDFRTEYHEEEPFALHQPSNGKLIIKKAENTVEIEDVDLFDGHLRITDDTTIIDDIRVAVERSETDSFQVEISRRSKGRTVAQARSLAREIEVRLNQQDSVLYLPSGISIPRNAHFRCQEVTIVVKVPVGKKLDIDDEAYHHFSFRQGRHGDWWGRWDNHWDHDNGGAIELHMTQDGLDDLNEGREDDRRNDDEEERRENSGDSLRDNYRYKGNEEKQQDTPSQEKKDAKPVSHASVTAQVQMPDLNSATMILYSVYNNMLK